MGPQIISLRSGIPFLPGPLERSSTVCMKNVFYGVWSNSNVVVVVVALFSRWDNVRAPRTIRKKHFWSIVSLRMLSVPDCWLSQNVWKSCKFQNTIFSSYQLIDICFNFAGAEQWRHIISSSKILNTYASTTATTKTTTKTTTTTTRLKTTTKTITTTKTTTPTTITTTKTKTKKSRC